MTEHTDELEKRTKRIREQMGGKSRLEKMEREGKPNIRPVSYTHLRAHET